MIETRLDRPWLGIDLGSLCDVLSFAPYRAGFVQARRILWREVRNADLPPDLDVDPWLASQIAGFDPDPKAVVGFLTSRDIGFHHIATAQVEGITATALATVGLSNAERIGIRQTRPAGAWGTINIAAHIDQPLTQSAAIEALTLMAQARTSAVIEAQYPLSGGFATGTGTDCLALASVAQRPQNAPTPLRYAGMHTALGEALGRATKSAVEAGLETYLKKEESQ